MNCFSTKTGKIAIKEAGENIIMSKYKKMKQLIADMRLPEYRYKQLLDAVFLQGIMRFEDMKLLRKTLREKLVEQFGETVVEIKAIHHEKSMQTDKVLFELSDGNRVETVGLFYKEGWNSFCISSQSGCGFGCKFCATGTLGLRRNLTVDEITGKDFLEKKKHNILKIEQSYVYKRKKFFVLFLSKE